MRQLRKRLFCLWRRELSQRSTAHHQAWQLPVHGLGTRAAIAVRIAARKAGRIPSKEVLALTVSLQTPPFMPTHLPENAMSCTPMTIRCTYCPEAVCFLGFAVDPPQDLRSENCKIIRLDWTFETGQSACICNDFREEHPVTSGTKRLRTKMLKSEYCSRQRTSSGCRVASGVWIGWIPEMQRRIRQLVSCSRS